MNHIPPYRRNFPSLTAAAGTGKAEWRLPTEKHCLHGEPQKLVPFEDFLSRTVIIPLSRPQYSFSLKLSVIQRSVAPQTKSHHPVYGTRWQPRKYSGFCAISSGLRSVVRLCPNQSRPARKWPEHFVEEKLHRLTQYCSHVNHAGVIQC